MYKFQLTGTPSCARIAMHATTWLALHHVAGKDRSRHARITQSIVASSHSHTARAKLAPVPPGAESRQLRRAVLLHRAGFGAHPI